MHPPTSVSVCGVDPSWQYSVVAPLGVFTSDQEPWAFAIRFVTIAKSSQQNRFLSLSVPADGVWSPPLNSDGYWPDKVYCYLCEWLLKAQESSCLALGSRVNQNQVLTLRDSYRICIGPDTVNILSYGEVGC